jgi:hypothetical protein
MGPSKIVGLGSGACTKPTSHWLGFIHIIFKDFFCQDYKNTVPIEN